MNISQIIAAIYEGLLQFVPVLRTVWVISVVLGITMLIIAFVLKKNPVRKKSPWVVGGISMLMLISSGTQLIMSFL